MEQGFGLMRIDPLAAMSCDKNNFQIFVPHDSDLLASLSTLSVLKFMMISLERFALQTEMTTKFTCTGKNNELGNNCTMTVAYFGWTSITDDLRKI